METNTSSRKLKPSPSQSLLRWLETASREDPWTRLVNTSERSPITTSKRRPTTKSRRGSAALSTLDEHFNQLQGSHLQGFSVSERTLGSTAPEITRPIDFASLVPRPDSGGIKPGTNKIWDISLSELSSVDSSVSTNPLEATKPENVSAESRSLTGGQRKGSPKDHFNQPERSSSGNTGQSDRSPLPVSEFLDAVTDPAVNQHLTFSDRYGSEIQNIACRLVYSWLEENRGRVQPVTRQAPLRGHAGGSIESASQNHAQPGRKARKSSQSTKKTSQAIRKRRLNELTEGDDEDDDEDAHDDRRPKDGNDCDETGRIWACPYCKHDPTTYSVENNWKCSTHLLYKIPRLKQHLYRSHCRPSIYCWTCFAVFETEELAQSHSVQEIRCQPIPSPFNDRITAAQYQALKKRTPKKTPKECWYHIYEILFPGEPLPESPFLDEGSRLQVVVDDLCHYVRVEAPPLLSERIREGLLQPLPPAASWEASVNDVVEEAVAHFCNLVAARAFRRGEPQSLDQSDRSTPELTCGSTEATRTTSGTGASGDFRSVAESSSRRSTALHQRTDHATPPDQTYDFYANLPEMTDDFLEFLNFDPVPKSGTIWNSSLPASWAVDP